MNVLVLSGGGQGGWGVLGALTEMVDTEFDVYIGTSVGGLIASLLSIGFCPKHLFDILYDMDITNKPSLINCIEQFGFCNLDCIMDIIKMLIEDKCGNIPTFIELNDKYKKELVLTGSCLTTRTTEYFNYQTHPHMSILDALYITCSVPIMFKPITYQGKLYIDGSLGDDFPVKYAKRKYKDAVIYGILIKSEVCEIKCLFSYISSVINFILYTTKYIESKDVCIMELHNSCNTMINLFNNIDNKQEMYDEGKEYASNKLKAFKLLDEGIHHKDDDT